MKIFGFRRHLTNTFTRLTVSHDAGIAVPTKTWSSRKGAGLEEIVVLGNKSRKAVLYTKTKSLCSTPQLGSVPWNWKWIVLESTHLGFCYWMGNNKKRWNLTKSRAKIITRKAVWNDLHSPINRPQCLQTSERLLKTTPGTWAKPITSSSSFSEPRRAIRKARLSVEVEFWLNMPAWMTFSSTFSLYLAAARIFSSTLLTVISLNTRTSFFWPIRWARSWACRSWSNKINNQWLKATNVWKVTSEKYWTNSKIWLAKKLREGLSFPIWTVIWTALVLGKFFVFKELTLHVVKKMSNWADLPPANEEHR